VFKNAKVYRLADAFDWDQLELHERLAAQAFRPCGPLEAATLGWVSPLVPDAELLAHAINGCLMVAARRQERLLPGSVVSEALAERVAELEDVEGLEVSARERRRLRDELMAQMLPRAFTRSRLLRAYIDPVGGWAVVDTASDKMAEEVLSLLRRSLDGLPVKPLTAGVPVSERLSAWLASGAAPQGLALEDRCELRDRDDTRAVVRCSGVELDAPEVRSHLESGKGVVALGLTWGDGLSFVLDERLALRRLRFADELIEAAADDAGEDEALRREAEAAIMTGQLRELLGWLAAELQLNAAAPADVPAADAA
jgi:recombination associated protein RdgC